MKVTVDNTIKDDLHTVEVEDNGTVEDLKVLLEVETQIPIDEQLLVFQNKFLDNNTHKLTQVGIRDGDIGKQRFGTAIIVKANPLQVSRIEDYLLNSSRSQH